MEPYILIIILLSSSASAYDTDCTADSDCWFQRLLEAQGNNGGSNSGEETDCDQNCVEMHGHFSYGTQENGYCDCHCKEGYVIDDSMVFVQETPVIDTVEVCEAVEGGDCWEVEIDIELDAFTKLAEYCQDNPEDIMCDEEELCMMTSPPVCYEPMEMLLEWRRI
jgi:hypothetical protein